jgi:hypothetical protein
MRTTHFSEYSFARYPSRRDDFCSSGRSTHSIPIMLYVGTPLLLCSTYLRRGGRRLRRAVRARGPVHLPVRGGAELRAVRAAGAERKGPSTGGTARPSSPPTAARCCSSSRPSPRTGASRGWSSAPGTRCTASTSPPRARAARAASRRSCARPSRTSACAFELNDVWRVSSSSDVITSVKTRGFAACGDDYCARCLPRGLPCSSRRTRRVRASADGRRDMFPVFRKTGRRPPARGACGHQRAPRDMRKCRPHIVSPKIA